MLDADEISARQNKKRTQMNKHPEIGDTIYIPETEQVWPIKSAVLEDGGAYRLTFRVSRASQGSYAVYLGVIDYKQPQRQEASTLIAVLHSGMISALSSYICLVLDHDTKMYQAQHSQQPLYVALKSAGIYDTVQRADMAIFLDLAK